MDVNDLIHSLYNEQDLEIRRYIPDKMAKLGDWKSTTHLGKIMLDSSQPLILRQEATESLGKQGDPNAVNYLIDALASDNDEIRRTAVWSLGQIGQPQALSHIFSLTKDSYLPVRKWIAKAAARIDDPSVDQYLRNYLESTTEEIVLVEILRAITGIVTTPSIDTKFWHEVAKSHLVSRNSKINLAAIKLLVSLYQHNIKPDDVIYSIDQPTPKDPRFSYYVQGLGYANRVDVLVELDHIQRYHGLGIANQADILVQALKNTTDPDEITSILEAFRHTQAVPDLAEFYTHTDLRVRLAALQLHALHRFPVEAIQNAYTLGKGKTKLIELFQYYPKEGFQVFSNSAFDSNKVVRQHTVYTMLSPNYLQEDKIWASTFNLLRNVAASDNIWHIRRDARIGMKTIETLQSQ